MKVKILSDLHLEFGQYDPGEGEVLILAGDVCTACSFACRGEEDYKERFEHFFNQCVKNYTKVYYVMGNHEHYNYFFDETEKTLREFLPEGITLLQNQVDYYNGWTFVGASLWSNYEGESEDSMSACREWMNDYKCVCIKGENNRPLDPLDTLREHNNTVAWMKQTLPTLDGPVFVITHHCPSNQSLSGDYAFSEVVGAYASNLEDLIKSHSNVKMWAHGHVHESNSYFVEDCRVISNPRGYYGEGLNPGFNPELILDLKHYVGETE